MSSFFGGEFVSEVIELELVVDEVDGAIDGVDSDDEAAATAAASPKTGAGSATKKDLFSVRTLT